MPLTTYCEDRCWERVSMLVVEWKMSRSWWVGGRSPATASLQST
jgi:hypothetical protein